VFTLALAAFSLPAQMKVEPAGGPPAEAAALAASLSKEGLKVLKEDGSVLCEMWFVQAVASGAATEESASFAGTPQGALFGVVRFAARHSDRRGQTIKPGVYSMRYSLFPLNGDHQGVAPQRDFLLLSPIAADPGPDAKPRFEQLVVLSQKASGTPHPLVFSVWKDEAGAETGIQTAENDQVLHFKIGSTPAALIIVGKHEG
jgi:hypothetical protein